MIPRTISTFSIYYILFLSGCGDSKKTDQPDAPVLPHQESVLTPSDHYFFQNPVCQTQKPQYKVQNTNLFELDTGRRLTSRIVDLSDMGITSAPELSSPTIASVAVGGVFERKCANAFNPYDQCSDNVNHEPWWQNTIPPKSLKLCDGIPSYDRESYESIAVQNIFYIEKVSRLYRTQVTQFEPVSLLVMPDYRSQYPAQPDQNGLSKVLTTHVVHNLAYFPGEEQIVIFPEPKDQNDFFMKKGHLWESAFAAAHELGHHLEFQMRRNHIRSLFVWDPIHHQFQSLAETPSLDRNTLGKALGSYSEGFADLAAYFALDQDESTIAALYGFGIDRSPRSTTIHNRMGQEIDKVLSADNVASLFDDTQALGIHDIGAIIAHGMYTVLSTMVANAEDGSRADATKSDGTTLLTATVNWFDNVTKSMNTHPLSQQEAILNFQDITPGIEAAVGAFFIKNQIPVPEQNALKQKICQISQKKFPILARQPFATHCGTPP